MLHDSSQKNCKGRVPSGRFPQVVTNLLQSFYQVIISNAHKKGQTVDTA